MKPSYSVMFLGSQTGARGNKRPSHQIQDETLVLLHKLAGKRAQSINMPDGLSGLSHKQDETGQTLQNRSYLITGYCLEVSHKLEKGASCDPKSKKTQNDLSQDGGEAAHASLLSNETNALLQYKKEKSPSKETLKSWGKNCLKKAKRKIVRKISLVPHIEDLKKAFSGPFIPQKEALKKALFFKPLVGALMILSFFLTGCSPYRKDFDCPVGSGMPCHSLTAVRDRLEGPVPSLATPQSSKTEMVLFHKDLSLERVEI